MLFIAWFYITNIAFRFKQNEFKEADSEIKNQLNALGPIRYEEKIVLFIFIITAVSWILRKDVINIFII